MWRAAWRQGVGPLLPHSGLVALREALAEDDPALVQGVTMEPPPLQALADCPVEAACAVSC